VAAARRFTATLTPADPERWTAVSASRQAGGAHSGTARPVSPPAPPA
jgi:hypothetical protein